MNAKNVQVEMVSQKLMGIIGSCIGSYIGSY